VVTKSGSFFSYGDERLGQGRNNAKAYLVEHVEVAKEIESKIYEALGVDLDLVQPIDPDTAAVPGEVPVAEADVAPAPIEQAA
jgi:recombination protein RecA